MDWNAITDFAHIVLINATPLALGAYSGILCERAGVINIAIEGMMLLAAMAAQLIAQYTFLWLRLANGNRALNSPEAQALVLPSLLLGVLGGLLVGALLGLLHGVVSIRFKADQIISGSVINILALGVTGWVYQSWMTPNRGAPLSPGNRSE